MQREKVGESHSISSCLVLSPLRVARKEESWEEASDVLRVSQQTRSDPWAPRGPFVDWNYRRTRYQLIPAAPFIAIRVLVVARMNDRDGTHGWVSAQSVFSVQSSPQPRIAITPSFQELSRRGHERSQRPQLWTAKGTCARRAFHSQSWEQGCMMLSGCAVRGRHARTHIRACPDAKVWNATVRASDLRWRYALLSSLPPTSNTTRTG